MNHEFAGWLADVMLALHVGVVLFVVGLLPLVIVGGIRGWAWVRHFSLRLTHVLLMVFIAGLASAVVGVCDGLHLLRCDRAAGSVVGQAKQGTSGLIPGGGLTAALQTDQIRMCEERSQSVFGMACLLLAPSLECRESRLRTGVC